MSRLARVIARSLSHQSEAARRQRNVVRDGKVIEVDAAKGLVKVDLGDADNPLPTPWIKWSERAGARKTWNPPSVGEVMTVLSPDGEISTRSRAMPGGFAGGNGAPSSNGDAMAGSLGDVSWVITGSSATVTIGGCTATLTASGLEVAGGAITITGGDLAASGGAFTHNSVNVGDTHTHKNVQPGPALSGPPS